MNALELVSVTKIMQKHFWTPKFIAVDALSFTVAQGGIVGFVGPNGAGKTTSIKMLLGLLAPTKGSLYINGVSAHVPASRKKVAFIAEQPYLYAHLSARESLILSANLLGIFGEEATTAVVAALERVDLASATNKPVKELSKGMQQRLSMASALLGNPDIFIFDEPMSGLDPLGRTLFRSLFLDLASTGKTIFFSTHILDDIEQLCQSIVVISHGKLMYNGPMKPILELGFAGTDIHVPLLADALATKLFEMGFTLTQSGAHDHILFVPKNLDPTHAQKILYDNGIFITSIQRRMTSLEDLLYRSPQSLASIFVS